MMGNRGSLVLSKLPGSTKLMDHPWSRRPGVGGENGQLNRGLVSTAEGTASLLASEERAGRWWGRELGLPFQALLSTCPLLVPTGELEGDSHRGVLAVRILGICQTFLRHLSHMQPGGAGNRSLFRTDSCV